MNSSPRTPTFPARHWISPHLSVRYSQPGDLPQIVAMLAKDTVCEHLYFGPNSEELTISYFAPLVEAIEASLADAQIPDQHVFTLLHPETREFVGTGALLRIDYGGGNYHIGYQLDDGYWNCRFGTWAARFLVQYAFTTLAARRITGDCLRSNVPSARIMRGCGFTFEGAQRAHYQKAGRTMDNLLFGLLRAEVDERKLADWTAAFERAPAVSPVANRVDHE